MPRAARIKSKTNVYHIVLRGINRQTIFEDSEDACMFLHFMKKYKKQGGYKILAYCLMGNHIHFLLKEGDERLEITMRRIGAGFVRWYNNKYERTGHLFQDRFLSEPVEERSYLLNVVRYIHQNPVKAGIVTELSKFQWSSYQEYTIKRTWVDTDIVLDIFHPDKKEAINSFNTFHQTTDERSYLDIKKQTKLNDRKATAIIMEVCGIEHAKDLQKLTKEEGRDVYLQKLKEIGLSTRQLARLTGISRGVIVKS